jgi:hypothetical protein
MRLSTDVMGTTRVDRWQMSGDMGDTLQDHAREPSAKVWNETNPVNERRRFIEDYQSQNWTMVDLCERYGISRNIGYELLKRCATEGEAAFEERSRARNTCPHRTPLELEQMFIDERLRCPGARASCSACFGTSTPTSSGQRRARSTTSSRATRSSSPTESIMARSAAATLAIALVASSCGADNAGAEGSGATGTSTGPQTTEGTTTTTSSSDSGSETSSSGSTSSESSSGSESTIGYAEPTCPAFTLDGDLVIYAFEDTVDLPLYTHVTGDVIVTQADGVVDLQALRCLSKVDGRLFVAANPDLESLSGLERLWSIGALSVGDNASLVTLEGLGIHHIEDTEAINRITRNRILETIALRELENTPNLYIGGCTGLYPRMTGYPDGNDGLREIDGLDSLSAFDVVMLIGNDELDSLDGLVGIAARTGPPVPNGPDLTIGFSLNGSLSTDYIQEFWGEYMSDGPELYTCGNLGQEQDLCPCPSGP